MNNFTQQKEQFLKKYFHYPQKIKSAITAADVHYFHHDLIGKCDINSVRYIKNTKELVKILKQSKYNLMRNWSYLYQSSIRIYDWASLYWCDTGLYIHFEWMSTSDVTMGEFDSVDMTEHMWQFFYQQRRKILNKFYPELTLKYVLYEDFRVQLTDHDLTRVAMNEN